MYVMFMFMFMCTRMCMCVCMVRHRVVVNSHAEERPR